jgi:hypothetical protein
MIVKKELIALLKRLIVTVIDLNQEIYELMMKKLSIQQENSEIMK